jgi:hypothetical protein
VIRAGGQADATEETSESGEREPGWRVPGPVLQGLIAFVIYLVVFILAYGQALLPHLNELTQGRAGRGRPELLHLGDPLVALRHHARA